MSTGIIVQVSTYPLELLHDAERLAAEAAMHPCEDGRPITTPKERTFARSAVFTGFNFLESLMIELTQQSIAAGDAAPADETEMNDALKKARASISKTITSWPGKLGKPAVHLCPEFQEFEKLRQLRNNLTHPKLHPVTPKCQTQDELLQISSAKTAAWAVDVAKKMGSVLYRAFGVPVPPEAQ